ncbi:MAG: LD-carboxypeptidase, partial [Bacteroidetes bacterium]|nr:LD-carboxypeptidase [Bacteroidota bacterium]
MIRKPPPLGPSSKVGIIAPASAPVDPNTLAAGLMALESRGLSVVRNRMDLTSRGYLAGDDRARSEELNAFLREPEIGALIGVRGGYCSMRSLANID